MTRIPELTPVTRWYCPNCNARDVTREANPHTRYHACPGLKGLTAPMAEEGTSVKITAVEREDYVGKEHVTYDEEGTAVMAVKTERADGSNDLAVMAPMASIEGKTAT